MFPPNNPNPHNTNFQTAPSSGAEVRHLSASGRMAGEQIHFWGKHIDFLCKYKLPLKQPAATLDTVIGGKQLSVVYENKTVYVEIDGLKVTSDDSSVASIINAVLKIYDVDITRLHRNCC